MLTEVGYGLISRDRFAPFFKVNLKSTDSDKLIHSGISGRFCCISQLVGAAAPESSFFFLISYCYLGHGGFELVRWR